MNTVRTSLFLTANLGSEMSQIFSYIEKGNLEMAQSAKLRAERIMKELLLHPEMKQRTEEIEIINKIVKDILSEKPQLNINKYQIEEYFMPFALRLMSV